MTPPGKTPSALLAEEQMRQAASHEAQQARARITRRREALGLTMRELAQQTRISIPVLEALEKGWAHRLPEAPYLRTLLKTLAEVLQLPIDDLVAATWQHPPAASGHVKTATRRRWKRRFATMLPPWQHLLTGWSGVALYLLLFGFLLAGLNWQQRRLAMANLVSLEPVAPLPLAVQLSDAPVELTNEIQVANPAVIYRPLLRPEDPVFRQQLLLDAIRPAVNPEQQEGVLLVNLRAPAVLSLMGDTTVHGRLKAETGTLRWHLKPPFQLVVTPHGSATVRWRGGLLKVADPERDLFVVPAPETPAAP